MAFRYQDRTDSVPDKLRLLEASYADAHFDLALSLADSVRQTLLYERTQHDADDKPDVAAGQAISVAELPKPWAAWARGWKLCQPVGLFETVGVARADEPVELTVSFPADQTTDLGREVRVAQVDQQTAQLRQVVCQVDVERLRGGERRCQLVFQADVPAHSSAAYLIFSGNPLAERPDYATDLQVHGEGYGLDVENVHYLARLSRQVGQLERLTYKRQHGLELYAGGKGHGEPPGIDWAHDYVDAGDLQKLRMRNWPECPNFEVTRGPLCVRVRRWGFPYSPVHPLFTPSRVHMDQSYAFHAGLPYFFKEGRIDVVKDVEIAAMRDDEWVFSGYSFTDMVWFDERGKLHEGEVPAESLKKLWGVGFYNRTSRDAFIALWLEHAAENFAGLSHSGPPTLHYDGHGQLWSRYPAEATKLKAGASIRQRNAYLLAPFEGPDAAKQVERLRHQLLNPLEVRAGEMPRMAAASESGTLARFGETSETARLKPAIWKALAEVRDEQLYHVNSNAVDLGYIYDVRERNGVATIVVTMPHRGRPVYEFLVTSGGGRIEPGIRDRLLKLPGIRDVVVDFTWNPPWTADRLTDAGRKVLGLPSE
jgi:metal-sulfur cluster biosynthetic enzyme